MPKEYSDLLLFPILLLFILLLWFALKDHPATSITCPPGFVLAQGYAVGTGEIQMCMSR